MLYAQCEYVGKARQDKSVPCIPTNWTLCCPPIAFDKYMDLSGGESFYAAGSECVRKGKV